MLDVAVAGIQVGELALVAADGRHLRSPCGCGQGNAQPGFSPTLGRAVGEIDPAQPIGPFSGRPRDGGGRHEVVDVVADTSGTQESAQLRAEAFVDRRRHLLDQGLVRCKPEQVRDIVHQPPPLGGPRWIASSKPRWR